MRKSTAPKHPEKVFKDFVIAYLKEELQQETQSGINQGFKQGFEIGFKQGFKQGFEIGFEQGVHQTVQKMLVSFSKKNPHLPIDVLAETFELDVAYVKKYSLARLTRKMKMKNENRNPLRSTQ